MARCYSASMRNRHPSVIPSAVDVWLVSDARNDLVLEDVLAHLPRGCGLIFRHYHLVPTERQVRFKHLARIARRHGHAIVLSGSARQARKWGADGAYGPPNALSQGPACLRLVTAHSLKEMGQALRARADAVLLSPVFATRSHPGARALGPVRYRLLAAKSKVPIIALGGMTAARAGRLGSAKWAAIDGICDKATRRIPKDS